MAFLWVKFWPLFILSLLNLSRPWSLHPGQGALGMTHKFFFISGTTKRVNPPEPLSKNQRENLRKKYESLWYGGGVSGP